MSETPNSNAPKSDGGGLRFNFGKNQLELIPNEWIWGLGMVLTRGAIKYAVRNWERGMKWSYPLGCALRHMLKFACGERYDAETGCHHLFMAAWNCCALATYDIRKIGENDLVGDLAWIEGVAIEPGADLKALIAKKQAEAANVVAESRAAAMLDTAPPLTTANQVRDSEFESEDTLPPERPTLSAIPSAMDLLSPSPVREPS